MMHTELELMVKAGLTPLETLADATSVPAKIFSLNDRGPYRAGDCVPICCWSTVIQPKTSARRATSSRFGSRACELTAKAIAIGTAQEQRSLEVRGGMVAADSDTIFKGNSKVRLRVVDGGPDRSPSIMILACDARPGIKYPFAGAMFIPALAQAEPKLAGIKEVSFWSKGDGKIYSVAMFTRTGGATPVLRPFIAGKDWARNIQFRFLNFTPAVTTLRCCRSSRRSPARTTSSCRVFVCFLSLNFDPCLPTMAGARIPSHHSKKEPRR